MTHKNDGFIENLMKVPAPLKCSDLNKKRTPGLVVTRGLLVAVADGSLYLNK